MRRSRRQHLLFSVNQIAGIEGSQLKSMAMRNRISRASLHAVPAKDASIVVDVIDTGVALGARNSVFRGVFRGFDVDAIRRTSSSAQKAGHTLLQPVFIALQHVHATETFLELRAFQRA